MAKAKTILECVVYYAKDKPKELNKETGKYDKDPKYKTEVHIEDDIQDGDNVRPSSLKLNTNILKEEFKKGPARFEVEYVPYQKGNKNLNSIKVLKILK